MDLDNHYSVVTLAEIGLSPNSTPEEIEDATDREMDDLDCQHGAGQHGCSREEMAEYLTAWVARENFRHRPIKD